MILIDGVKYSCLECIRGHRTTLCQHDKRPLLLVKKKGRPNLLFPNGNKNYRIAVFAQEVADEPNEDSNGKCRNRPVVILKASDKYVFDIKRGQVVGPYCEEGELRVVLSDNFVITSSCCLDSLSTNACSCNQRKVLKKRILQSYLKKNRGKVDMNGLLRTHATELKALYHDDTISKPNKRQSSGGCCGTKIKQEGPVPLQSQEIQFMPIKTTQASFTIESKSKNVRRRLFKREHLLSDQTSIHPHEDASQLDLNIQLNTCFSDGILQMSHSETDSTNLSNSSVAGPLTTQEVPGAMSTLPTTFNHPSLSNLGIVLTNRDTGAGNNDMLENGPPFDYAAALCLQNHDEFNNNQADDFLIGDNNQVFKLINVPMCSVPGTCLCSPNCGCPNCEIHNGPVKKEEKYALNGQNTIPSASSYSQLQHSAEDATYHMRNINTAMSMGVNNSVNGITNESFNVYSPDSLRNSDCFSFLKQIMGSKEDTSPDQNSEGSCTDDFSEPPTRANYCSCTEGACFCSNCERHGIIDGIKLDDLFSSVGRRPSIGEEKL